MLRAQLKRDLKAGRVSIGALLLDPPAYLEAAKVRARAPVVTGATWVMTKQGAA